MPEYNGPGFIDTKTRITLGQVGIIIALVASALLFYFKDQSAGGDRLNTLANTTNERISHVETDMGQRIATGDGQNSDRIGKLEVRAAVIEQHQTQEDAAIADTRTAFNSFASDVRQQLNQLITATTELRSLIVQTREGNNGPARDGSRH
jgi:hypothetical protein